jgi:hypothetical protein
MRRRKGMTTVLRRLTVIYNVNTKNSDYNFELINAKNVANPS